MVDNEDKRTQLPQSFSLDDFVYERLLSNNANRKVIFVLGRCFNLPAIVILEKIAFTEEQFSGTDDKSTILKNSSLEKIMENDIYQNNFCRVDSDLNKLKATIIYPATEKHISKYTEQKIYVLKETPELYKSVTLPCLEKEQFNCDWVYNILEHRQEVDRIVIEDLSPDVGFMLLPDLKWDGVTDETMYVTAIIMNRSIKSIRDLRESHLPLLENIKSKCLAAIKDKYGVNSNEVRAYFHYQPSYYHLHVHFNYLKYDAPGIFCDKAHLLDTVIDNIKMVPNYYEKATLSFTVRENDKLYDAYKSIAEE
ncbi:unnamed protein product [Chironomus riparius]|uniref:m7GpppX diphosphatase n=1 Tax=Chironomus riparius TaxID=315576 RepID=A0A9N9WP51_9DIPT|nr:unnamed protein product [Chironomus riparius]